MLSTRWQLEVGMMLHSLFISIIAVASVKLPLLSQRPTTIDSLRPILSAEACATAWSEWSQALLSASETAPILQGGHYTMVLFDRNGVVCRQNRDYAVGGDPIFTAVVDDQKQDLDVDLGLCGEETVGSVRGGGGFGQDKIAKTAEDKRTFRPFPTRQCYQGPITFTATIGSVFRTKQMSLYPRYRLSLQVGILYSDQHQTSFGLVKSGDKSFIVDQSTSGKGPEYVAALNFYALPRYLQRFGGLKGLYKGRDPVHESAPADRVGGIVTVGLTHPDERAGIGLTYELLPGLNFIAVKEWVKAKALVGVDPTAEFKDTAEHIPTRDAWSSKWTFGVSLDLLYAKKLLTR
jgi:hypothetical protein